jgi:hypothetical protein
MVRAPNGLTVVRRYGATQLGIECLITAIFVTDLNAAVNAVGHFASVLPKVWHCDGHAVFMHKDLNWEVGVVQFNPGPWEFQF